MKFDKYKLNKDFTFKEGKIYLTKEAFNKIYKLKKITGSRIGAVLGHDSYKTPFQIWCEIFGFFKSESSDYFLKAGSEIESKLRLYAEKKFNKKFISYSPEVCGFDVFKNEKIFGGIPDGEEYVDGKLVSILEIKTASFDKFAWKVKNNEFDLVIGNDGKPIVSKKGAGLLKWFKNGEVIIPENYKDQLSLYLYLRGISKGYFCVCFVKEKDYENPSSVNFMSEFNNYRGYDLENISISSEEHILVWYEHTIDLEEYGKQIKKAQEWYEEHIFKGVSPKMTSEDLAWFRYGYPELS